MPPIPLITTLRSGRSPRAPDRGVPHPRPRTFALAVCGTTAFLCVSAAFAFAGASSRVAPMVAFACLPYGLLLGAPLPPWAHGVRAPVAAALVPGLCLCLAPSVLSDDVFRYAWDAHVWLAGRSAYARVPLDPALVELRAGVPFDRINHPTLATIYPPVAQATFVGARALLPGLFGFKAAALLAHVATIWLMPRALGVLGNARSETRVVRATWLWALNPLSLAESALSGHVDALAGLLVLCAALLLKQRAHPYVAVVVTLLTGIKLVGWLIVPTLFRRAPAWALAAALGSGLMMVPLLSAGAASGSASAGLVAYGQHWQGNAGGFALLERLAAPIVGPLAVSTTAPGAPAIGEREVWLPWLGSALDWAAALGVDPHAAKRAQRKTLRAPTILDRGYVVGIVARLLAGLSLALALGWAVLRLRSDVMCVRVALLTALLCMPQVHPWYLLWLLPLDLALSGRVALTWSVVVLGAYAPLAEWNTARTWTDSSAFVVFEYAVVGVALLLEQKARRASALTPPDGRNKLVST